MSSTMANVSDFDDDEGGLSGFTILAIAATLLVVFALVVSYAYKQGVASAQSASEELPVVAADPNPVADDVPLDATRDSARQEVYDRVSGAVPTEIVTAENPANDALDGYSGAPASMSAREQAAAETATNEPAEEAATVAATTSEPEVRTVNPPSRNPRTAAASEATPQRQQPIRTDRAAASQTTSNTTPVNTASATGAVASGTHVVQVGAFPSNDSALDHFDGLSTRMGTMLSGKLPDIQVAEVNGRTYHRLRIGPFGSKAEADRYCADLKTRGQDCLVRGL